MPTETGIWNAKEAAEYHAFDYELATWIGETFDKKQPLIDVGCGRATYLRYLHDIGFENLLGIEGEDQVFKFGNVFIHDLTTSLPGNFAPLNNVICLEVGEHIPKEYADTFIHNITEIVRPGGLLLLSWAVPDQDGVGHVNCQHNIWVIKQIQNRGFSMEWDLTLEARLRVSNHTHWFRNTLMVFKKH